MDANTITVIANLVIFGLLFTRIITRELRWQPVNRKMFRVPAILAVVGVALTVPMLSPFDPLGATAGVVIAVEILTGFLAGAVMGMLRTIRPSAKGHESRGGPLGVGLWIALIALRIGESLIARHFIGGQLDSLGGLIMIMVAANRFTAALVVIQRTRSRAVVSQPVA